jgi:CheY-like chemotaxis protein
MDGAAMLRHMAATQVLNRIPVIMMSSIPESALAQRCSGYIRFMRKPFNVSEVLQVIQQVLGHSGGSLAEI